MTASIRSSRFLNRSTLALVLGMITLTACGGGGSNPAGPSSSSAVTLNGSVVGSGGASSSSSVAGAATTSTRLLIPGVLAVSVLESPNLTATVGADGSFTLRGLPTGSFTLVFTRDGARIGTLSFTAVLPNQELNITVSVSSSSLVLLEEQRNGIGHGDLEIEGSVEQVLIVSTTGDSRFVIHGRTVVARPGQTTILEGNAARGPSDLHVGVPVHVKGVWLPAEGSTQPVLAYEIRIQADEDDDGPAAPTPTPSPRAACITEGGTPGRGVELEGTIASGNASSFRLSVNGGRAANPVDVLAGGATLECTPKSGPNAPTPAQCSASVTAGAKVHVSGTLDSCSAASAQVTARRVSVQK
jgi:Domain of unknown function (DUF5666)